MLVLGLDPASVSFGYGYVEVDGERLSFVEAGDITAPATWGKYRRLVEIGKDLEELLVARRPDAVALEHGFVASFGGHHQQGAMVSAAARGVAGFLVARAGIPIFEYAPATVKKTVTGSGRADKAQVGKMVRLLLEMRSTPSPDAGDALAVAITHARLARVAARAKAA